jgi:hypothetical protein
VETGTDEFEISTAQSGGETGVNSALPKRESSMQENSETDGENHTDIEHTKRILRQDELVNEKDTQSVQKASVTTDDDDKKP